MSVNQSQNVFFISISAAAFPISDLPSMPYFFFFLVSSFLSKSLVVVVGGKEHFIREKRDTMRHKEKEKKSLCSCREMKDYASPCAVTHSPLLRDSRDERHKSLRRREALVTKMLRTR